MGKTLYEKVFDLHTVRRLPSGQYQLFIGLHLIHEVTTPQAFAMLEERGLSVAYPARTFATVDHIIPTHSLLRPFKDTQAEAMLSALELNVKQHGIRFYSQERLENGIVHVLGPERGLTQPGMTICCGDSHTSTHGAFGALAFGIGTSQVRDVLATQTLAVSKLKVRRVEVNGKLGQGVYAKDVALFIINRLGVQGGVGYAYEFAGEVFDAFSMEERMTVCNMSIEGGARVGYVNPDQTTYDYLQGRPSSPQGNAWEKAVAYWDSIKSDADAQYDDVVRFDAAEIEPVVTWGITPGQSVGVSGSIPNLEAFPETERGNVSQAYDYMKLAAGQPIAGLQIDVAFIGSCTNARISDFQVVAELIEARRSAGQPVRVAPNVRALAVPGSQEVKAEISRRGYDRILKQAGFELREPGCSMCLAMNPDRLHGDEICASSSNRNFKGRQGSPDGRTLLMSPAMVAAAAFAGEVTDVRSLLGAKA
ncbi:MAG: 3-isopropylmalate dehydratase large subunit [Polyangiaceae bacterium]|nr:3-isopropylmalate dehydratase large subunit [Myxococcales bacterium]MCB9585914.1 3-isopropylmalate dehydratase large subunit [Polyangiaceae bacterium]MCB9607156.1 3-isopropylmalate dehydratase large subunit [Polyangiaceae bacterium]